MRKTVPRKTGPIPEHPANGHFSVQPVRPVDLEAGRLSQMRLEALQDKVARDLPRTLGVPRVQAYRADQVLPHAREGRDVVDQVLHPRLLYLKEKGP